MIVANNTTKNNLIISILKSAIARHGKIRVNSVLLIWLNAIVRFWRFLNLFVRIVLLLLSVAK